MHYTYMVKCSDGTYYCGYSTDPAKRTEAHNRGRGAKYTKSRLPVKLVYVEEYDTKEEAMHREWEIKQMKREQKIMLIKKR